MAAAAACPIIIDRFKPDVGCALRTFGWLYLQTGKLSFGLLPVRVNIGLENRLHSRNVPFAL
jgi:hypothetical protein